MSDTLKDELLAIWDSECVSGKLWQSLRARLARATVTEPGPPDPCVVQPTDAERLDALRRELKIDDIRVMKSSVEPGNSYFAAQNKEGAFFAHPRYDILRAPDGIRKTADALRWLAQSGEGE